ncbi:MAG: HlyD family efflux transporter periplasmic adaptor subunit [Oceanobacter sp.]|jgi:cobalt-zinc-cadmium efflux system membrane fusion protein
MRISDCLRAALLLPFLAIATIAMAGGDQDTDHEEHDHDAYEEASHVQIQADIAHAAGIRTDTATRQALTLGSLSYGRLTTPPNKRMAIRARFPGIVIKVQVKSGDTVKRNDVLAQVESNESLRGYEIRAPFAGTILSRHVNPGSVVDQQPLFQLINTDTLWAEIRLFGDQQKSVQPGQMVRFQTQSQSSESLLEGQIERLIPVLQQPYTLARAVIDNRDDHYSPGDLLEAQVLTESRNNVLTVDSKAIQEHDGQSVVFVVLDDTYEAHPVLIGQSNGRLTEVIQGLEEGERYVTQGSYVIKADLEKSGASHDH